MTGLLTASNFFVFVLCYLIGSFPTAYVFVKLKSDKDITKEGSGNVGTLNSFKVSGSKIVGASVLLIDLLKGLLPVYIMMFPLSIAYPSVMLGACGLILGHNFPVWLKFKGGRGLATGAGIFFVVNYFILIGWCLVWLIVFSLKKRVLISNTVATFCMPLYIILVNNFDWLVVNSAIFGFSLTYFTVFSIVITIIILSRHTEVFKNLFQKKS
ncbi:MAG: glycerol-3-phosphate acyltransferase [Chlorobi bacterium]|nr:glycerol-3-phosphate acyltransferase [Chlorobiota bacterium]MCI0717343.1 glycerol-3-phosphate acyltransferase [Chlorobiota bacterium]